MSPVKPGEFILEQRHIEHGLTREDFNRYAGYPVLDFYLSDLPHWDELLENGILPHAKQQERSAALFKKIAEEGVSKRFSNPSFFEDAAWDSSTCACQAARDIDVSWTKKKKFINSINSAGLGSCGYTKPIDVSKFCGFFSWNRAPSFAVFPGVVGKIDYNKSFGQNRAAIVMRVPVDVNGTQMRLKQNGLLNDPFKSASFQKQLSLAGDLHEMRHLLQVTTSEYGAVEKFYNEMDADIFARDVLRQSEACADLMEARHHMRYLDMLVCQRKYLFPPVIDAIEKRRCDPSVSIPTFEEVVQSVAVLRKSLAAYPALVKNGRADTDFSLRLSVLFKIAQNETFSNPLARDIFLKIQDAAEYFCPGISQERGLPVRKDKTSSGISQKFPAVQVG